MMLSILTKRLCPLMSLAIVFGCGKKINDPETTSARNNQGQTTELPATFSLTINEAASPITTYQLQKNGWFQLPAKLFARESSAIGKQVRIYYNLMTNGDYEFRCNYKSLTSSTELAFVNCENQDNREIIRNTVDLESMDFPMDKGSAIKMQLTNPTSSNIKIEAIFQVDWK